MASTSGTRLSWRLLLLALLLSCFWHGSAFAQKFDALDLEVKVSDARTNAAIADAEVKIYREGTNNKNEGLKDRSQKTGSNGVAYFDDVDFDLTGQRTATLTATVKGYKSPPQPFAITDLIKSKASSANVLGFELSLEPEDGGGGGTPTPAPTASNVNGNVIGSPSPDSSKQGPTPEPFDWFGIPAFFSWVASGVNYVAFWLGWLTILSLIGLVLWHFLIRRRRPHFDHHSHTPPQVSLKTLDADISDLKKLVRSAATKEEIKTLLQAELQKVNQSIKDIQLPGSTTSAGQGRGGSGGFQGDGSTAVLAPVAETKPPVHLPFKERAHQSYLKLANRETPDQEPFYVEVPTKSTLFGKLADATVYLTNATHRGAAFVLFTEDDKLGWVFPNPMLSYRKASLKDVFPDLTEEVFDAAKERIEPVQVVRADEARWKVG